MARLKLIGGALRLPIVPLSAAGQEKVERALRDAGLL
jgi:hypothetical protein